MAKKSKSKVQDLRFDEKLVLFKFMQRELGINDMKLLAQQMNRPEEEGVNDVSGNTLFVEHFLNRPGCRISDGILRTYDEHIQRWTRQIGEKRGGLTWKYFQYLSLLFTEIYLDRWFSDKEAFQKELTDFLHEEDYRTLGQLCFSDYDMKKMNKLAFMSATGSGKTLILHANILQFNYYLQRAKRSNANMGINKMILLTPNESMSRQHEEELKLSGIPAEIFVKDGPLKFSKEGVCIIDVNKLEDVGKAKTVSVDSFETNNLLLVDEGHRGLSGEKWFGYRQKMAEDGFTFEYSATFKQALAGKKTKKEERDTVEDYQKAIIFDYSYKHFYNDGYGKDYRIYNLKNASVNEESRILYLTGCLLNFYQQKKCFAEYTAQLAPFHIEDPLLVFVGNSVTKVSKNEDLSDVEDVVMFIDQFVRNKFKTIQRINLVIQQNTGLIDAKGMDIFSHDFNMLYELNGGATPDGQAIYEDVMRLLFNTVTNADEPRLHLDHLSKAGEIAMRVGEDGDYFGVISIGDTAALIKSCEKKGIVTKIESFNNDSLFDSINRKGSKINVLVGSRKFTEGWNSWRVSTMGLINFAKGEGAQAIQMFGRGVRLKGYNGMLKRSAVINNIPGIRKPKYINKLETLTIFGVKANYMEEFKAFLELEDVPSNDQLTEVVLPTVSRYEEVKNRKLRVIRVKEGKNFKRDAERKLLVAPTGKFKDYLINNMIILDCRSKVQGIESTGSLTMRIGTVAEPINMPADNIPVLDYFHIFDEIELYKNEKQYFNITIDRDCLQSILADREWYQFIIPKNHLKIESIKRLEEVTDFAIMALKSYMDRFFKFEKEAWEDKYLEYGELEASDNNFVDEYRVRLTEEVGGDYGRELEKFINDASTILSANKGIKEYQRSAVANQFVLFDFRHHLYAPLVCVKKNNLKIQVSPVQMNEDEKKFVDLLDVYIKNHSSEWKDKSLFLLRNKSKVGMGFFEAGNFYPDYILWIDTEMKQYINFIDPKGLLHFSPKDAKIIFYKKIKELEERLAPTSSDKQVVLNSFIMSSTRGAELRNWWHMHNPSEHEAMNVYTLDDDSCVEKMIKKILE